jgi:uncharacterized protein (TIGR01777 family)
MKRKRIILAGGSGFIGQGLGGALSAQNYEVVVLTRQPRVRADGIREVSWDGKSLGDWAHELDNAECLINLAGRSVNCRYTPKNRRAIMDSRVFSTRILGEAIAKAKTPPRTWMNSSTATIYKHATDVARDEKGEIGATADANDGFSVEVAHAWEAAFDQAVTPSTRKITLRTSLVFGADTRGVFRVLRRLAQFGLGGKMASGEQYVSWIHETDFARAILWLLEKENFSGSVNLAAPNPLTNCEMMRIMRGVCKAPLGIGLPAARWMLEVGAFFLRTETELILKSRRVVPGRLLQEGFKFQYPDFEDAVRELERRVSAP